MHLAACDPPDATIALLSGAGEVNAVFSVPPFQQQQLMRAMAKLILSLGAMLHKTTGPAMAPA